MTIDRNSTAAVEREHRYVALIGRRLDLSAEARGLIRHGDGRPLAAIKADQATVEADIGALVRERAEPAHAVPV